MEEITTATKLPILMNREIVGFGPTVMTFKYNAGAL